MIVLFVQAAEHCLELGNFFTLFSILGALGFPQVTRLSAAWDRVPSRVKQLQAKLRHYEKMLAALEKERSELKTRATMAET